ncbi:MAG: hypothetical protein NTX50_19170 [Candidatus Sumerlaeota bacterium]|nr:hypothetical protein [Candidatus Sumerlaeota bacterium]
MRRSAHKRTAGKIAIALVVAANALAVVAILVWAIYHAISINAQSHANAQPLANIQSAAKTQSQANTQLAASANASSAANASSTATVTSSDKPSSLSSLPSLASFPSSASVAPSVDPAIHINQISLRCENPQIALGYDGWVLAVWEGYAADSPVRQIWFAERSPEGVWTREICLSAGMPDESSEPSIAVDPRGYPHAVWCARKGATNHVFYSRRRGALHPATVSAGSINNLNYWSKPQQLDVADELNCQTVSIAFDYSGRPSVIWQGGLGTLYRVYAAFAPHRGKWRVDLLGTDEQSDYCSFPQLVPGERTLAVWYEAETSGLKTRAAFAPEGVDSPWTPAPLRFAASLPADRLVEILRDRKERLWAMWTDARDGVGERVWFAPGVDSLSPLPPGKPFLADDRALAANRYPSADGGVPDPDANPNDPKVIVLVWVVETKGEKRIAIRAINPANPAVSPPSRLLSDPSDPHVASPSVRQSPGGAAHVVWDSSYAGGGSGNIYYAMTPFRK